MRHFIPMTVVLTLLPQLAFAVGGDDETPPEPTETTTECSDGQIYDAETEACVDAKEEAFNDDLRYDAVRELAYAGRYDRALTVISKVDQPDDARFLNYQGFIYRKQGDYAQARAFYKAALLARPDYHLARSYMGQGMVAEGDLGGAQEQLDEIAARGGAGTWAHTALVKAIKGEGGSDY